MPSAELLKEANRQIVICNACRYCEGFCAVFPAMERRRTFTDGDFTYLANLCFDCRACFYACQYAPPHEFNVNVPIQLHHIGLFDAGSDGFEHSWKVNIWSLDGMGTNSIDFGGGTLTENGFS